MNEPTSDQLFTYAFNGGVLALMQLLKELDGIKLKAAILAAEKIAGQRVQEVSGTPLEDTLLQFEPWVTGIMNEIKDI